MEKLWELESRVIFGRINRQGGLSSDDKEMAVFKSDSSKSERGMVLVEIL